MNGPSQTVHIVDDDEYVRTALGNLLSAAGYAVRVYSSGTEFLLSAPKAVDYYPHIGFTQHPSAWTMEAQNR